MGKLIKGCFTLIGAFFVVIIMLGVIANMGKSNHPQGNGGQADSPKAEAPRAAVPEASLSASQLLKAYENNKLQAQQTYEGHRYKVSGIVTAIGSDIADQPYVTVGTGAQFEVTQVQCMFAREQSGQLAKLNKGQSLSVEGTVKGYVMNVLLEDCRLAGGGK